jgi:hypothetical protein
VKRILLLFIIIFSSCITYKYIELNISIKEDSGKGHTSTPFPTKIIYNSPEDYVTPFYICYWWYHPKPSIVTPQLTFLFNYKPEKFHIYYIEFQYKDNYFKYEVNKDFVINYNDDRVYFNETWVYGGYYFLEDINFGKYFSEIKPNEEFVLNTNIAYQIDNEDKKIQNLNYIVRKYKTTYSVTIFPQV